MRRTADLEARRWLAQARADLADAAYNREGGRHHLACFLAHQSAEKALKALLFLDPDADPWGHSVRELCQQAARADAAWAVPADEVAPLDQFYIPTRYPNGLPGGIPSEAYSADDSARAIALADRVVQAVSSRFPA